MLLVYGLLNAALYSSLLPVWEGFDEEFHYGYVQYLGAHHRFPVLGQTGLSLEINRSIGLLPMSHVMVRLLELRGVRTFDEYFALDRATRHALHDAACAIPAALRGSESTKYYRNYEAHQAPLAYVLMTLPDTLMSGVPLPWRVWIVRLLVSAACVVLMFRGLIALGREAGLDERFVSVVVFLMFSCQMFWATVAHIGNDWLAVPLAVWLVLWAMRGRPVWAAVILGLGLLSKAYFLVLVPLYGAAAIFWYRTGKVRGRGLALMLAIPLAMVGPWYGRNVILYGNLSGRQEETAGVTVAGALQSLGAIPWLKSLPFMARGAFWMGNDSFTDFSVITMDALLAVLGVELILYCLRARWKEAFLWAPVVLFCAAMLYVTGSSYVFTRGLAVAASPWYLQPVMGPLLVVAMLGCQRGGGMGRWLARISVVLWGYILAASYIAKLFPLYGGFAGGRSTLREVAHWYAADWPRTSDILSTTAMVGSGWLVAILVGVVAMGLVGGTKSWPSHP